MTEDQYRQFMLENRENINELVNKRIRKQDETLFPRLKSGLLNCVKKCYFESISKSDNKKLTENQRKTIFNVIKLLVLSIKKRYYAFPDRSIIGVVQDHFFDKIIPRAIQLNLISESYKFLSLLFNVGENLGVLSQNFYEIIDLFLPLIASEPLDLASLIQVIVWAIGDLDRRQHALRILNAPKISPSILIILQFKSDTPSNAQYSSQKAKLIHDLLLSSLKNDYWRLPGFAIDKEDASIFLQDLQAPKSLIAESTWNDLNKKYAKKTIESLDKLTTIGSLGSYRGFKGHFETPPIILGMVDDGVLIVYTENGGVYYVTYCRNKTSVRSLGTFKAKSLCYSREMGLIGLNQKNEVYALSKGTMKISRIPRTTQSVLSTIFGRSFFILEPNSKLFYRISLINGKASVKRTRLKVLISSIAAISENNVLLVSKRRIKSKTEYHVNEFNFTTKKMKSLVSFNKSIWVATNENYIVFLEKDGKLHVMNRKTGITLDHKSKIQTAGLRSLVITDREIITSYDYTHRIYFHGPPI